MNENCGSKDRKQIAFTILTVSGVILVIISFVYIIYSEDRGEAAEKTFTTLIPLLGTWIGTVLAYYFSGENFQRATDSVSRMAQEITHEKLKKISVQEAMISIGIAIKVQLSPNDPYGKDINLKKDILDRINDTITRIPILDHLNRIKYILHGSLIYKFITQKTLEQSAKNQSLDVSSLTLNDLIEFNSNRDIASSTIAFIKLNETLAEAKTKMEQTAKCQDVIVTDNGERDGKVLGWITNVIISQHAKA